MSGEDIERLYVKHTKLQLFIFCLFVFLKSSLGSQQNWSTVCSNMPPPLPSLIPTTPTNERERERDRETERKKEIKRGRKSRGGGEPKKERERPGERKTETERDRGRE